MRSEIRLISFDVWNTLISANPEFGKARTAFLAQALRKSPEAVNHAYREVKDNADRAAETHGHGMTSEQVYAEFLGKMGVGADRWLMLRHGLERVFQRLPPIVRPEIAPFLQRLAAEGYALSIGSNTNFIRGECLHRTILGSLGVTWEFQVFSDELGRAKPHPRFWREVLVKASFAAAAKPHEILHVGDNKVCDGGCVNSRIQFAHINGPDELAPVLETILGKRKAG